MTHKACGEECAKAFAIRVREKVDRKSDRERRQAMKTRQDWLRDAQTEFNGFIRERDAKDPCISCGRYHDGSYDAGHYRSVGAQPALRFEETNCHKQCVPCNQHRAGNVVEYRIRLLIKIGEIAVAWLEQDHPEKKLTIDEIKAIRDYYKAKRKELKRGSD